MAIADLYMGNATSGGLGGLGGLFGFGGVPPKNYGGGANDLPM